MLEYSVLLNASGVSSEESSSGLVKIFPNPVKEKLIIQSDQSIEEIQLSDVFKRLVIKRPLNNSHETELAVNNLRAGIYFITVKMKNGIKTERIVVESE